MVADRAGCLKLRSTIEEHTPLGSGPVSYEDAVGCTARKVQSSIRPRFVSPRQPEFVLNFVGFSCFVSYSLSSSGDLAF